MNNLYINRELSWLDFNHRVLLQAQSPNTPLFERLRFISIFQSNLDEFTMVRIGTLIDQLMFTPDAVDNKTKLTPQQQLDLIHQKTQNLLIEKDRIYHELLKEFKQKKYILFESGKLPKHALSFLSHYYEKSIAPLINPQLCDATHPFPQLTNKQSCILIRLKTKLGKTAFGAIPIPESLTPAIVFNQQENQHLFLIHDIISFFLKDLFPDHTIEEYTTLKAIRSADSSTKLLRDEQDESYLQSMREMLKQRRRLAVVCLYSCTPLTKQSMRFLNKHFNQQHTLFYQSKSPSNFNFLSSLESLLREQKKVDNFYPYYVSSLPTTLSKKKTLISQIIKQDQLLIYPYHSMSPVIQLISEASRDPHVISIKITLYRLAKQSKIIDALIEAADQGKEVTVLLEIGARFDEENNIIWSNKLEASLVNVMYGYEHYKIHAKAMLISFRHKGTIKHIAHLATGNYNEQTAQQYTDINLFTANDKITLDIVKLFQGISRSALTFDSKYVLTAPNQLKNAILELIDNEIKLHNIHGTGRIVMKMNSLSDRDIIDKLNQASLSGVKVQLIVRGICCIKANDNLQIISILGRFLEHARIFYFYQRGEQRFYLSSADMMTRNTEHRIEIATPVLGMNEKRHLLHYLEMQLEDPEAYHMNELGEYHQFSAKGTSSQSEMIRRTAVHQSKFTPINLPFNSLKNRIINILRKHKKENQTL